MRLQLLNESQVIQNVVDVAGDKNFIEKRDNVCSISMLQNEVIATFVPVR